MGALGNHQAYEIDYDKNFLPSPKQAQFAQLLPQQIVNRGLYFKWILKKLSYLVIQGTSVYEITSYT